MKCRGSGAQKEDITEKREEGVSATRSWGVAQAGPGFLSPGRGWKRDKARRGSQTPPNH